MKQLFGVALLLFATLSLWNSIADFWAAYRTRVIPATVLASKLRIDWGRADSESQETPLYTLSVDLKSDDGSARTFSWEGDPGAAVYPEEALDELKAWGTGTKHNIGVLRGNAKEIRINQMESNPEIGKGVAWLFGFFVAGITGIASLSAANFQLSAHPRLAFLKGFGVWTVFLAFGLMPLLGSFAFAWGMSEKIATWKPVIARKVGESAAFDTSKSVPNVEVTLIAMKQLTEHPYDRIEFDWNGQKLHGGIGSWQGIYDHGTLTTGNEYRFLISPRDRWEIAQKLSWGEDFGVPFGLLLFFGLAFTGAAFGVRRMERRFH